MTGHQIVQWLLQTPRWRGGGREGGEERERERERERGGVGEDGI